MSERNEKIKIEIRFADIPEEESDRALFAFFDFLLAGKEQIDTQDQPAKESSSNYEI